MTTGLDIIAAFIIIICGFLVGLHYLNKITKDDRDGMGDEDE